MSIRTVGRKYLATALAALKGERIEDADRRLAIAVIGQAAKVREPKPMRREREANEAREKASKRLETGRIYRAVEKRAGGRCECGCGTPFASEGENAPQMDHFWGRGKVPQTVENCWMLTARHHAEKGGPGRLAWLGKFKTHADGHRYFAESAKAAREIESELLILQAAATTKGAR